ncbi:hypothetical protein Hanom_Chr01g00052211 [Helianthus anomalus]
MHCLFPGYPFSSFFTCYCSVLIYFSYKLYAFSSEINTLVIIINILFYLENCNE